MKVRITRHVLRTTFNKEALGKVRWVLIELSRSRYIILHAKRSYCKTMVQYSLDLDLEFLDLDLSVRLGCLVFHSGSV